MKLLVMFFLAIPSVVFANQGHYIYQGQQGVFFAKRYELVYAKSSQGKERLEELRENGYACVANPNMYRCTKFLKNYAQPKTISPNATNITLGPITKKEIITEGESSLQYIADQEIQIDEQIFSQAKYTELAEITKFSAGPESDFHFINEKDALIELYPATQKESKFAWVDYMVEVFYNKVD